MRRKRQARKHAKQEAPSTEPIGTFPSGMAMAAAHALKEIAQTLAATPQEDPRGGGRGLLPMAHEAGKA